MNVTLRDAHNHSYTVTVTEGTTVPLRDAFNHEFYFDAAGTPATALTYLSEVLTYTSETLTYTA